MSLEREAQLEAENQKLHTTNNNLMNRYRELEAYNGRLQAENKRLRGQMKLMDEKAQTAFGCFWNGGWYDRCTQQDTGE